MNETVNFTITLEDEHGNKMCDIDLKASIYTQPYEPADRHYPGCPKESTVEEVEIVEHPDMESVVAYVDMMGGTYQDFVEEDDPSGVLLVIHRDKGIAVDTFNSDAVLEYLGGTL